MATIKPARNDVHNYRVKGSFLELQEFESPTISRQSAAESCKVVSPTQRPPLPPRTYPCVYFYYRLSPHKWHSAAGRVMLMNDYKNPTGNRTRSLPACCAVPQKVVLPHIILNLTIISPLNAIFICACVISDWGRNWFPANTILSLNPVDYVRKEDLFYPRSMWRQASFVFDQIVLRDDYLAITDYKAHFACC